MDAPLGQVTVLSLTIVTGLLRGPQYATTSTSFWSHSARHAAVSQLERMMRTAASAGDAAAFVPGGPSAPAGPGGPGGPAGPAGPGSPFSPAGPTGPGSPLGPVVPSPQPATQIKTAIAIAVLLMCMHAPSGLPVTTIFLRPNPPAHRLAINQAAAARSADAARGWQAGFNETGGRGTQHHFATQNRRPGRGVESQRPTHAPRRAVAAQPKTTPKHAYAR